MKELYEAIVTQLEAEIPELKMIDFEMGQLDVLALDIRPSVKFPCALIDISYSQCEDESEDTQQVTARVNIRLAFECPLPTDNLASDARRTAALAIFSTVDLIYKNLQGFDTAEFSAFSRKSQTPDNRYAGIKIINMVFETTFEDLTAHQV
jgi:hypothetical protein